MITLIELDGNVQGFSSTSLSLGTGSKQFVLLDVQPFEVGMTVTAKNGVNTMTGSVTRIDGLNLFVSISSISGSGTFASWEINGVRTVYLATQTVCSKPTDVPANTDYLGCVTDPGNIAQYMFEAAKTYGKSSYAKGTITCTNNDGALDWMEKIGFTKSSVRIKQMERSSDPIPTEAVFAGTALYVEVSWRQVVIEFADRLAELDQPAQEVVFAGTNSGATGIEGSANGIKGSIKPWGYGGQIFHLSPILLNEVSYIYGFNFDANGNGVACTTIHSVWDQGVLKTIDTTVGTSGDVANLAALQGATIASGKYITCKALSLIRFAGIAAGLVTCSVTISSRSAGGIVENLLQRKGFNSTDDYVASTFTALDALNNTAQEFWTDSDTTYLEAATQVLNGIGGFLIVNNQNKFEVGRLNDPTSGSSVFDFEKYQILSIDKMGTKDEGSGVPPKQIKVEFNKNYAVMNDSDFAGSVTLTHRLNYSDDAKESVGATSSTILAKHSNAPIFTISAHHTTEANAAAEVTRQETLRQTQRNFYSFTTSEMTPLRLGDIVTITAPRMNLSTGKKVIIMGREIDLKRSRITYLVWG